MAKKPRDDEPLSILDVANKELAIQRLSKGPEVVSKCVTEVFKDEDPDARFKMLAKAYIWNQGDDLRTQAVTDLAWAFGANRTEMKRLLRRLSIVAKND